MIITKSILKAFSTSKLTKLQTQYVSTRAPYHLYQFIRQLIRQNKNAQAVAIIQNKHYQLQQRLPQAYKIKLKQMQNLLEKRGYKTIDIKSQTKQVKKNRYFLFWSLTGFFLYYYLFDKKLQEPLFKVALNPQQQKKQNKVFFTDVHGIDQFKDQLLEIVDYLKNSDKYRKAGAKLPKGILLVGPPGTGKTLMARALANEANCTFLYRSGSQFDQVFVGTGSKKVRDLFKQARQKSPAIVFIDEIDSIVGNREAKGGFSKNDTINQILIQMDGFTANQNIIVIGATNLQKSIDPAIKRAGRFDKIIHVPLPDIKGRQDIFSYYLKKIKIGNEVTAKQLARRTIGFTGADISNMVNQAILNAVKNQNKIAQKQDFQFAYDRIVMGVGRKNLFLTDKDKLITAYHQCGHTLVALLTKGATPLHKVTLLPRGGALGFTSMVPQTDNLSMNRRQYLAHMDIAFGGKVAQQIFMGSTQVTSGSSNDLQQATNIATNYIKNLGMQEKVTLIAQNDIKVSQKYLYELDKQVERLLQESYNRVKKLLIEHKDELSLLAKFLIEKQTLDAADVHKILKLQKEK